MKTNARTHQKRRAKLKHNIQSLKWFRAFQCETTKRAANWFDENYYNNKGQRSVTRFTRGPHIVIRQWEHYSNKILLNIFKEIFFRPGKWRFYKVKGEKMLKMIGKKNFLKENTYKIRELCVTAKRRSNRARKQSILLTFVCWFYVLPRMMVMRGWSNHVTIFFNYDDV